MGLFDAFRFDGKRVVVVGGATGMGAAAAELAVDAGAEVVVLDYAPVTLDGVKAVQVNLGDKASIDAALAEIAGPINALLSCAGVADGTPNLEKINYAGHRHMIDSLIAAGHLSRGSSIGFISSAAGLGWESNLDLWLELMPITDYDEISAFLIDHGKADYFHTKQAICTYVAWAAHDFAAKGIRINAICPGPTDTPLAQANKEMWLGFGSDWRELVGVEAATPIEQAYPLLFLCSDAARSISGQTLVSDAGYLNAGVTRAYPPAEDVAKFLLGKFPIPEA